MKKEKMDLKREITKTKKREKIVIHNVDGTTEEYKTGILFTLEEINFKGDGEVKFIGKHCNTKEFMGVYVQGLAHIVMAMIEDDFDLNKMFEE